MLKLLSTVLVLACYGALASPNDVLAPSDLAARVKAVYSLFKSNPDAVPMLFAPNAVCSFVGTDRLPWSKLYHGQDCVLQLAGTAARYVDLELRVRDVLVEADAYALRAVAWLEEPSVNKATGIEYDLMCAHEFQFNSRLQVTAFKDLCNTIQEWQAMPKHPDGDLDSDASAAGDDRKGAEAETMQGQGAAQLAGKVQVPLLRSRRALAALTAVAAQLRGKDAGAAAGTVTERERRNQAAEQAVGEALQQVAAAGGDWPIPAAKERLAVVLQLCDLAEAGDAEVARFFAPGAIYVSHGSELLPYSGEYHGQDCAQQAGEAVAAYMDTSVRVESVFLAADPATPSALVWVQVPATNRLTKRRFTDTCAYHITFTPDTKAPKIARMEEVCNTLMEYESFPRGWKPPRS